MNRLYVVSTDGRVFYAEHNSRSFENLEIDPSIQNPVKIKKLSSCEWSLWGISTNLRLYLYVFKLDTPYEHIEVTYQNQRRYNLFSDNFIDRLLPTDRANYTGINGGKELQKSSFKLPSKSWLWKTEWTYEKTLTDGWEYALNWPTEFKPSFFYGACVRRKKWTRTRQFAVLNNFIEIPSPSENECLIDVSVGGWLLPYCQKGFLCVWIVSTQGNLYFRENVSHSNLEGSNWKKINLPTNYTAFACCCSCYGDLWVITDQGECLVRIGISRDTPWGTKWLRVEQAHNEYTMKEIGVGKNVVWALDTKGNVFYRAGISDKNKKGTKWVLIPSSFSNISVSNSNQIWSINNFDNILSFRYGIDEENLNGICWREIILKYKKYTHSGELNLEDHENEMKTLEADDQYKTLTQEEIDSSHENTQIEDQYLMDESIYDIYGETESANNNYKSIESDIEKDKEVNIEDYLKIDKLDGIQEVNQRLDHILEELENKDTFLDIVNEYDTDKQRSYSSLSNISEKSSLENLSFAIDNKSDDESVFDASLDHFDGNDSSEFTEIYLKSCCANSFYTDYSSIPASWYDNVDLDSSITNIFSYRKLVKNSNWRNSILNDLKQRNINEHTNIDRISIPYNNDSSWSSKEEFLHQYKNKIIKSILEIEQKSIYDNPSNKSNKTVQTTLIIKGINKNKIKWQESIDFRTIFLVTRCSYTRKSTQSSTQSPCFAIYSSNRPPLLFFSSSDSKAQDWINQISIHCSRQSGIKSLLNACTIVNSDNFAYYSFLKNYRPLLFNQIDGHFKIVDKHFSGVTVGIGENGKLWVLTKSDNTILDSYKGPYVQTDELEIDTFENQRWYVMTGLLEIVGLRSGFTNLNFPTDRYPWSDETGSVSRRKEECTLPSNLYSWSSNWQIDYSLKPNVDREGWQYSFNFPGPYHGVRNPVKDFVRRRKWVRRCSIKTNGLWQEVKQSHKIISISFDQELQEFLSSSDKRILVWATDADGYVLCCQLEKSIRFKWIHVPSKETFQCVSIGCNLRIWGVDLNGNVYLRLGVDKKSCFTGASWSLIKNDNEDEFFQNSIKFKLLSAGNDSVWAISVNNELYFRENISKIFPEGTGWTKISDRMKYVTVNHKNQVYAITSDDATKPNVLLYRDGITSINKKGVRWLECFQMKCKMISNRGCI